MPKLSFESYIICFKKQFLLQKGRGGRRTCAYYTNYNQQQSLKNDQWGIMVFIHCGGLYGFTDGQMLAELKINKNLYDVLKEETPNILHFTYPDKLLHKMVHVKIGLVKNAVFVNHCVKVK